MSSASKWDAVTVRKTFVDYFTKQHGHTFVPSSKVVPYEDPTLLFVNSGMVQVSKKWFSRGSIDTRALASFRRPCADPA